MKLKPRSRPITHRTLVIGLGVVVIALLAAGSYELYGAYHKTKAPTSSTLHYNPQNDATKNQDGGNGGVVDKNSTGTATSSTSTTTTNNSTTTSTASVITLTSPTAGSTIGAGTIVKGTAAGISTVQYRIKDAVRGVIATGSLQVSNGSFNGTIEGIEPASASGTFEIYNFNTQSGAEENNIKVSVNFK